MAQYRKVDSRIWNDEKFSGLSDKAKLVFFFVMTHPHMTSLGAMRASIPGLASELGWTEKAFREAFAEALLKAMLKHDESASFVWLPKFLKYNRPESPNVVKAWRSAWDLIPECNLKYELFQSLKAFAEGLGEAFSKAFTQAFPEGYAKDYALSGTGTGAVTGTEETSMSGKPDVSVFREEAEKALDFLNAKTGRAYRPTDANLTLIVARLREGATLQDLKSVVAKKTREWEGTDMAEYLRPATLFNATKFNQYVGELVEPAE